MSSSVSDGSPDQTQQHRPMLGNTSVTPKANRAQVVLWVFGGVLTLGAIVGIVWVSQPALLNSGIACTTTGCTTPDTYALNQFVLLLAPSGLLAAGLICIATAVILFVAPSQAAPPPQPITTSDTQRADPAAFMRSSHDEPQNRTTQHPWPQYRSAKGGWSRAIANRT